VKVTLGEARTQVNT